MLQQNTPVFLVGCPRSGTTLLQSLLSAHSLISSFPESHFFQYLLPAENSRRRRFGLIAKQLKPWLENYFKADIQRSELLQSLPKLPFMYLYTQTFFKILLSLAREQGKTILLEKTPQHIFYLKPIIGYFPQAKIIHLIRNGADVVASFYHATHNYPAQYWDGAWELDKCIDWWNRSIKISQSYAGHPHHFLVRYEELVKEPETILQQLCDFLNVDYDSHMIQNYHQSAQSLTLEKAGRTVNYSGLENRNSQKFYEIFTTEQQNYILSKLEPFKI